jgi:hypothetical protein
MDNGRERNSDPERSNWDVQSFLIRPETEASWGIGDEELGMAHALVGQEARTGPGISFKNFSALVTLLYNKGFSLADINEDIRSAYGKGEIHKDSDHYRELQMALNLFSNTRRLTVDGKWGPSSGRALSAVTEAFHLLQTRPGEALVRILKQIAARVPRIAVLDGKLRAQIPQVPYYFIIEDIKQAAYTLRIERARAVLNEVSSQRTLLTIGLPKTGTNPTDPDITGALQGALLLYLKPLRPRPIELTRLEYNGRNWERPGAAATENNFLIRPDFVVDISPDTKSFQLSYHSGMTETLEFFVLLTVDGTLYTAIKPGMVDIGSDGRGLLTFELPEIPRPEGDPDIIQLAVRGDLLKLFAVRKGFTGHARADETASDGEHVFYRLISIDEEDLYYTATIGLLFPPAAPKKPAPFTNKWVRVAGTGLNELSHAEEWMSAALGRALADAGFGLICGGWTGVDQQTADAFSERLEGLDIAPRERLIQLQEKDEPPRYRYGTIVNIGDDWFGGLPHRVSAMVIIGGAGGAMGAFYSALIHNVPVLPLAGTGGAAADAFKEMFYLGNLTRAQERILRAEITDAQRAGEIATAVIEFLGRLVKLFPKPFTNRWVVVAGTGNPPISESERWMSIAAGRMLAQYGYGLLSGGWPGIDEEVAKAFSDYLKEYDMNDKNRLIQVLERNQQVQFSLGSTEVSTRDWYDEVLSRAVAVILIGGEGGTFTTFRRAEVAGVQVFPIPATGGDAKRAFLEMSRPPQDIDRPIEGIKDAFFIAESIRQLIPSAVPKKQKGLSIKDFEKIVDSISAGREITDKTDLQKGRWGESSKANGKLLSAQISLSDIPNYFNIKLSVSATNGEPLKGWVAFLLHDTFRPAVKIVKAKTGKAETSIQAFDGFTVGAYTEDGTSLELNLSQHRDIVEQGVPENFKQEVMRIYDSRPIQVTDDLQKLRWGGKPINDNKTLSAKVSKVYGKENYTVTAVVSAISGEPLAGFAAFFLDGTFPEPIRFATIAEGKAQLMFTASDAFTIGAYTSDGARLELDLQTITGYPKEFYYKPYGLGKNGAFTPHGIMKIVESRAPQGQPNNIPRKNILLFESKEQKTWLVATDYELFILLDDKETRKENNLVMSRLNLRGILPLVFGEQDGAGTIKFANMDRAWYYTKSLFRGKKSLKQQIEEMVESAPAAASTNRPKKK